MKKQVNLFLILLVVISVCISGGLYVFYQEQFRRVNDDFLVTYDAYQVCNASLAETNASLLATEQRLQANIGDVNKTLELFEEKQAELSSAEDAIASRDAEITRLRLDVAAKEQDVTSLQTLVASKNGQIATLENTISFLRADLRACEDDLDAC